MKDAIESDSHVGTWVGCILAKDDKFYYGNYDNEMCIRDRPRTVSGQFYIRE